MTYSAVMLHSSISFKVECTETLKTWTVASLKMGTENLWKSWPQCIGNFSWYLNDSLSDGHLPPITSSDQELKPKLQLLNIKSKVGLTLELFGCFCHKTKYTLSDLLKIFDRSHSQRESTDLHWMYKHFTALKCCISVQDCFSARHNLPEWRKMHKQLRSSGNRKNINTGAKALVLERATAS